LSGTVLALVSDLHTNSTIALCPPYVELDDGGGYRYSAAQRWLWANWKDYWERVKTARAGKRLYIIVNGDAADGDHHDTPQIITRNPATQRKIAETVLKVGTDLMQEGDRLFFVRGTESHVGKSGWLEEELGEDLKAERDTDTGAASSWHLLMEVEGVAVDIAHHGKLGGRSWTRPNAVNALAAETIMQYAERGERPPQLVIRSHRHKTADSYDNYPITRAIQTPAWQLMTAFSHKVATGSLADIGGIIVTCERGEYSVQKAFYKPARPKPWREPKK
jgi:hypothetical protein